MLFDMKQVLYTIAVIAFIVPTVRAQGDLAGKISCHGTGSGFPESQNQPYTKKLWDGYEISLGPARNAQGGGDDCTAAIYNSEGHVAFRTTGFSVIFDENLTGQDFDGDGKPEVVFITDTGGGNHCCWTYKVISLYPKPHKLFDVDASGAVQFKRDEQGKMLVWSLLPGPYGFTSMARAPFAQKVFRVRDAKLVDATPDFCDQILSDKNEDYRSWNRTLTPENIGKLSSMEGTGASNEEIISALLSRALQNAFCRNFDAALGDLNLWPEATRSKMMAQFSESIKQDYPEFAARLMSSEGMASAQAGNLPQKVAWLKELSASETFLAANLTTVEREQITGQLERTSFDIPDSWESELRVRRVSLGEVDGLLIRETRLLCGGTGNCETWFFRRSQGDWVNLFEQEAPIVSGFGFEQQATGGIKNFLVTANSSAATERRILFRFDGEFYRQSECYDVSLNTPAGERIEKVPCK